ncbi:MAG: hypothetical protein QOG20_2356 [Pseudonocardiales bacterium]|jgi:hypothetical protein|nr:hypothetical protein [Pseudonocardiales bacterium]
MTVRAGGGARRSAGACVILVVAAVLLTGCASPQFTYVTNASDHTYLKVPTSWQAIDQKSLEGAFGLDPAFSASAQGLWLAGYDAAVPPSLQHLLGTDASVPALLVGVKDNPESVRGQFSLDKLRDLFFPVSPTARQSAVADPSSGLNDFQLFTDDVLTPGSGVRGVHDVFRYSIAGGPPQMFDQTVYVNDDASKVYMFFVRCSTECYMQQQKEISTVVSSFTVREKP